MVLSSWLTVLLFGTGTPESGALDREVIRQVMHAQRAAFYRCYERPPPPAKPPGKVVIQFVIGVDGAVSDVTILEPSRVVSELAPCLRDALLALRFPRPTSGPVTVTYPFIMDMTGP